MTELRFDVAEMLAAAREVAAVVKPAADIPIMTHLAIVARDGLATLIGSDLDHQIEAACPADGAVETTIPADKFVAVLGALREKSKKAARKIGDDDWTRLRALHDAALTKQDGALAKLIAALRAKNAWNDTLLIVTSDVGLGAGPEIPFDPAAPLTEDRLLLPLLVRFPGDALAGKEIALPTTATDIASTIRQALGLEPLPESHDDLFTRGSGVASLTGDVDVAAQGKDYSARLGGWLLRGSAGKTPRLCASDIDPACINDVMDQRPAAARALWLAAFDSAAKDARRASQLGPRERAEPDPDTLAALTVWGDVR